MNSIQCRKNKYIDTENRTRLEYFVKLNILSEFDINVVQIAAVKNLFAPSAFDKSNSRILKNDQELEAKNQVELDPIVLCETKHGYIIITAWGR